MVRPNQIIASTDTTLTFLMFARSEKQVKRRVMLLNFPGLAIQLLKRGSLDQYVEGVELVTEGIVNRYEVTVDIEAVNDE